MDETQERKKKQRPSILWILIPAAALLLLAGIAGVRYGRSDNPVPTVRAPFTAAPATARPAPAAPARAFSGERGYMPSVNGLFCPESGLTRGLAAELLGADPGESGDPEEILTEETLCALVASRSDRETAEAAMESIRGLGDETVTRAEAALFFNRLFGLNGTPEETTYFPDAAPDYWAWAEIQTAGTGGRDWPGENGRLAPGFVTLDGYLYLADESGYFRKNQYAGSLKFDHTGRYTSGSYELDDYVAAMLRETTSEGMTREEMLRAAYEHVRDGFTYLVRHYYNIGDEGWALGEALTMYSTGKGNCYCFASAFWAAARQLGYEAKIVSGTYGTDRAPHGWVEIYDEDGVRHTFDPEVEMVLHRRGAKKESLYDMSDSQRRNHEYVETPNKDNIVPRETNEGLLFR